MEHPAGTQEFYSSVEHEQVSVCFEFQSKVLFFYVLDFAITPTPNGRGPAGESLSQRERVARSAG
jgi:hypothetical protein